MCSSCFIDKRIIWGGVKLNGIVMYTDGACSGNPGPGGWACILVWNGVERGLSGRNVRTTNNEMELSALVNGLKLLNQPCELHVFSDSKYVCNAINKNWLRSWIKDGSINSRPNSYLWKELVSLLEIHKIKISWVKGHAGNKYNEMCDRMAVQQRDQAKLEWRDTCELSYHN